MAEIFGADKKAMANSVFVNQGTLEKVLFEEGADRTKAKAGLALGRLRRIRMEKATWIRKAPHFAGKLAGG